MECVQFQRLTSSVVFQSLEMCFIVDFVCLYVYVTGLQKHPGQQGIREYAGTHVQRER